MGYQGEEEQRRAVEHWSIQNSTGRIKEINTNILQLGSSAMRLRQAGTGGTVLKKRTARPTKPQPLSLRCSVPSPPAGIPALGWLEGWAHCRGKGTAFPLALAVSLCPASSACAGDTERPRYAELCQFVYFWGKHTGAGFCHAVPHPVLRDSHNSMQEPHAEPALAMPQEERTTFSCI